MHAPAQVAAAFPPRPAAADAELETIDVEPEAATKEELDAGWEAPRYDVWGADETHAADESWRAWDDGGGDGAATADDAAAPADGGDGGHAAGDGGHAAGGDAADGGDGEPAVIPSNGFAARPGPRPPWRQPAKGRGKWKGKGKGKGKGKPYRGHRGGRGRNEGQKQGKGQSNKGQGNKGQSNKRWHDDQDDQGGADAKGHLAQLLS